MVDALRRLAAFRYFLLREMSLRPATPPSPRRPWWDVFNADLANDLGNLFSRALAMTHKYFDGQVPQAWQGGPDEEELMLLARDACRNFQDLFGRFQTAKALDALWELVRGLNKYIDAQAPWTLHKEKNTSRLATVIYCVLEGMRKVAAHLQPVMPEVARTMLAQLGAEPGPDGARLDTEGQTWGLIKAGTVVAKGSNLFPRLDVPRAPQPEAAPDKPKPAPKAQAAQAAKETPAVASGEAKPAVEFEDFQKLDLRVARVLSAEPVPQADKLLLVKLDLGESEPRQVVAGIAQFWKPEDLVSRQVVMVANLKPRKLRGVVSQGMILAVRREGGLELLGPSGPVDPGSPVS